MVELTKEVRRFLALGSLNAFLAIALGAFGAHGLKSELTIQALQTWQTAFEYHIIHALGLVFIAMLLPNLPRARHSGWFMLAGIVLFSGSLYLLALTGVKSLGMITPFGGLCFLAAWLWLVIASIKT